MMQGSCLCGAVRFTAGEPLRPVIACHCTQCRKTSGHYWAATSVPRDRFHLTRGDALKWFRSSDTAERGFCGICSASLFWKPTGEDRISIAAGSLDGPSGLSVAEDWHLESAGDYYTTPQPATELLGSCLCGANRFTLPHPMGEVSACHCRQCRKLSGHFSASFDAEETDVTWLSRDTAEFRTPGGAVRGACPTCGCNIYFRGKTGFSIEAGVIDNPTGGRLVSHIFTADKGDYYQIADGLPQFAQWD